MNQDQPFLIGQPGQQVLDVQQIQQIRELQAEQMQAKKIDGLYSLSIHLFLNFKGERTYEACLALAKQIVQIFEAEMKKDIQNEIKN